MVDWVNPSVLCCGVTAVQWARQVDPKDYQAALSYLTLKYDAVRAAALVGQLRKAPVVRRRVNDVLRASRLKPLKQKDPTVKAEAQKVEGGRALSPILVLSAWCWADIADGYHRASYLYWEDPTAEIPLKIVPTVEPA